MQHQRRELYPLMQEYIQQYQEKYGAAGVAKARQWYSMAAKYGHCRAALHYSFERERKDKQGALEIRKKCAELGDAKARQLLAQENE